MDFKSVIDKIMPEVISGSDEPLIIYRKNDGEWHSDFTQNQNGETFGWVNDVKEQDLLFLECKGSDFAKGSFPYVYDYVLKNRLREEYNIARSSGKDNDSIHALFCFFEDNIAEFSHIVTDYLTTLEKPLAALYEMCPFSMAVKRDGWDYNEDLSQDAVTSIENAVNERLQNQKDKSVIEKKPHWEMKEDKSFNYTLPLQKTEGKNKNTSLLGKLDDNKQKVKRNKANNKNKSIPKKIIGDELQ